MASLFIQNLAIYVNDKELNGNAKVGPKFRQIWSLWLAARSLPITEDPGLLNNYLAQLFVEKTK